MAHLNPSSSPPSEWKDLIENYEMMYTECEPTESNFNTYVGNGYIATQANIPSIFVAGVFNGPADSYDKPSHRARIPSTVNFQFTPDLASHVTKTHFGMNMQQNVYLRRFEFDNLKTHFIEERLYTHRKMRNVLVSEFHLLPKEKCAFDKDLAIEITIQQNFGSKSSDYAFKKILSIPSFVNELNSAQITVFEGETLVPELPEAKLTKVFIACEDTMKNGDKVDLATGGINTISFKLTDWSPFIHLTTIITDLDDENHEKGADLTQKVLSLHMDARKASLNRLNKANISNLELTHVEEVEKFTRGRGLEIKMKEGVAPIKGIPLPLAVNSSLYYITSSCREDWDFSLSPGSLSSNDYNGHTFWDCEIWDYPDILMFFPQFALSILRYRLKRIGAGKMKAKTYESLGGKYEGCMFPWESAFLGVETCPTCAPTGLYEVHISADVVFAFEQFYNLFSNNKELLSDETKKEFFEMSYEVGKFFASRSQKRTRDGPNSKFYDVDGVIPPDEYAVNVHNSIYTNAAIQKSFEFLFRLQRTFFQDKTIPERWREIAENLYMPYDAEKDIYLEYEGYKGELVKQGDVILLSYPFMWKGLNAHSKQTRRNNLDYYAAVSDFVGGPAMTSCMFSIGYLEEKDFEKAHHHFETGYVRNIHGPFCVWSEVEHGGAVNFITGAGGFLQSLLFGYSGLRIKDNGLEFDPVLPKDVERMSLKGLAFQNSVIDVEIDSNGTKIHARNEKKENIMLTDATGTKDLGDKASFVKSSFFVFPGN